jgi:hypothetical protein
VVARIAWVIDGGIQPLWSGRVIDVRFDAPRDRP